MLNLVPDFFEVLVIKWTLGIKSKVLIQRTTVVMSEFGYY